jgi:hypothetical protein
MSGKNSVAALREHLETLFPGKWITQSSSQRTILTGLSQIDQGITHGLQRRKIAEWIGSESCGKTTVLRTVIRNWCTNGMYVVYIDSQNRLLASDWAFVDKTEEDQTDPSAQQQINLFSDDSNRKGKFWIVRQINERDVLWSAEQLVPFHTEFDWFNPS